MEKKNSTPEASYEVNFKEGKISVSGPVDFVKEEIDRIKKDINLSQLLISYPRDIETVIASDVQIIKPGEQFENMLSIDHQNKKVNVLIDFSDKPKSQATVELTLIYLWGKKQVNIDEVSFQDLRILCQQHGVLDSANFSSHINNAKSFFIINKESGGYTAKLTVPGFKEAEMLLNKYNKTTDKN